MNAERLMGALLVLIAVFVGFIIFVAIPIKLSATAKCLAAGYPETKMAWNLKTYCMTLDGSVTVLVEESPK